MTRTTPASSEVIPKGYIEERILRIRGRKVMLDRDLAELYGVTTGNLNKAVQRQSQRFPEDFMFQLTPEELDSLRFHSGSSKPGRGGRRYLPYAFTQEGVAMLSGVLHSERAVAVNVQIMRTFVRLRSLMLSHQDLTAKMDRLERRFKEHDQRFEMVFEALRRLFDPPAKSKDRIGFHP